MREDLLQLKNVGPASAAWLESVGVESLADIEALGAVAVYRRLRARWPLSRTMLWALQGALLGIPYNQLPEDMKRSLAQCLEREEADNPRESAAELRYHGRGGGAGAGQSEQWRRNG